LVSVYYYLRVIVALYMRAEHAPVPGVLEALAAGHRTHALQGPGAMAAEPAALPPRVADGRAWPLRAVVAICLFATLWLGIGVTIGPLPGVSRVLEWAEVAAASLR